MKGILQIFLLSVLTISTLFSQPKIETGITARLAPDNTKLIQFDSEQSEAWELKVSPLLSFTENKYSAQSALPEMTTEKFISSNKQIPLFTDLAGNITVPVFIKVSAGGNTEQLIKNLGGVVYSRINDIITAELLLNSVKDLAISNEVKFIDAGSVSYPMLDASRAEIKADQVHAGNGLPQAYQGEGVVVGVLDSGIDWKHQDFKNAMGNRIQYLWDMSGNVNPPGGYGYGTEYTKAQLDLNQCSAVDGDDGGGHGTHVASTAAGNGGGNPIYVGMAPKSDIVFVKGFRTGPGFADVDVVNGCNYIFQKAASMGKPAVINLSLGGHFGPHDGTSLYEQSLSGLTGAGKIIVAAAGNEGSDQMHLSYTTGGSGLNDARQTFVVIQQGEALGLIDMWYDTGNISVGIAAYDGSLNFIGATNPVAPGQKIENLAFNVGGTTYANVTIDATTTADPNNNAKRVVFVIDNGNGAYNLNAVYWSIYTFGNGTFDAWLARGGYFTTDNVPAQGIYPGDNNKSIGMPSTAQSLICVGSYVTKNQWTDIDGILRAQPGNPTVGSRSSFSSIGPARDGRTKPDLTAPGEVIIAALSTNVTIGPNNTPRANVALGGLHQKMQGTSMATPHVTGVVALMLQRNGTLNYAQALNILRNTARKDGFTGGSVNNFFGSGKIDALAAVQNTPGGSGGQVTLLQEGFDGAFLPPGWQQTILNTANTWRQGNPQNNNFNGIDPSSLNSAICPWVNQNQDERLITPALQLGNGAAYVEFYAGYSTQWLSSATMNLLITTNGVNYTQIWTAENDGGQWAWRKKTVDLTSYANQAIKLAWQYVGNDGDLVGLDGVKIVGFLATGVETEFDPEIPADYSLSQNYPNPFNPSTAINVSIPKQGVVSLKVYDILGKEAAVLMDEEKAAGTYKITFTPVNLASGIYFYSLKAGETSITKKMLLIK